MKKNFSKSDLKDGDIVTFRDADNKIVNGDSFISKNGMYSIEIAKYNNNLTHKYVKKADVVKVERIKTKTVFERVDPIELVRGEVYFINNHIFRYDKKGDHCCNSIFSQIINERRLVIGSNDFHLYNFDNVKFTTPQQKAALISAEIENGYLWDDKAKELIKIDK